jgi:hypothetical protein
MAAINTNHALPTPRVVSVWVSSVELSVVFLTGVIFLALLTLASTCRYFLFLYRYGDEINKQFVPDGRIDWIIHAAKVAREEEMTGDEPNLKDRDYFRDASLVHGEIHTSPERHSSETAPSIQDLKRTQTSTSCVSSQLRPPRVSRVSTPKTYSWNVNNSR